MQLTPRIQDHFSPKSRPQGLEAAVLNSKPQDSQRQQEALEQALRDEDTKKLSELFSTGLSINDSYVFGTQETTPLAFSIQERKLRATRFLAGLGADVNASVTNKQGQLTTPLKMAEQISLSTGDNRLLNVLLSGNATNKKFDPKAYRASITKHEQLQKQILVQKSNIDTFKKVTTKEATSISKAKPSHHSTDSHPDITAPKAESLDTQQTTVLTDLSATPLVQTSIKDVEEDAQKDPIEIVLGCLRTREPIEKYLSKCPNLLDGDTVSFVALDLKDRVADSKDSEKSQKKIAVRLAIQEEKATLQEVKAFWNKISSQAFGKPISELFVAKPLEGLAAIAGMDEMKRQLDMHVISRFRPNPDRPPGKQKTLKKPLNGLILSGLPGTGKTYTAERLAEELGFNHMKVKLKDIQSKWHGDSGKLIASLFQKAEENKPCALIFDEFDSFVPDRGAMSPEQQLAKSQVNDLLQELENAGARGILAIATTNHLKDIDEAIIRPGRFDRSIIVPPPYLKTRIELFRMYLKQLCLGLECFTDTELRGFAERTKGYSSKDIEQLCTDADSIFEDSPDLKINAFHVNAAIDQRKTSLDPQKLAMYYLEPYNLD